MNEDDLWEMLFFLFASWPVIMMALIVLVVLSLVGVIPWGEWV